MSSASARAYSLARCFLVHLSMFVLLRKSWKFATTRRRDERMKNQMRITFCVALLLGLTAPAFAWDVLNDSEQPGSVLVFHKFIRGTGNDLGVSGQPVHANSEFEISALCPVGESCQQNAR